MPEGAGAGAPPRSGDLPISGGEALSRADGSVSPPEGIVCVCEEREMHSRSMEKGLFSSRKRQKA